MINFLKYDKVYFAVSGVALVLGIFALITWGLKPAIDFTGGSRLEIKVKSGQEKVTAAKIQKIAQNYSQDVSVKSTEKDVYIIRSKPLSDETKNNLLNGLKKLDSSPKVKELQFESIGPKLGHELLRKTIIALLLDAGLIFLYIAWRFFRNWTYGLSAILAMFHDSLILLGSFAFLGHFLGVEADTLFVTALLTTLSFSVHDTIVVYDRIREKLKKEAKKSRDFAGLANEALNETLLRSLYNSLTIIIMLVALVALGGKTIRWFLVALLIGMISGTYSSIFIATPLLIVWYKRAKKLSK